jgi:tetratricopeptide (TPR) repeat protein
MSPNRQPGRCVVAVLAVAIAVSMLNPDPVRAEPEVTAAVKLKVVRLAREGKQAFARQQYAEALERWKAAYALWPRPALLFNLALAYDKLDDPEQSLTFLREFLAESQRGPVDRALLREAERMERKLAPLLAELVLSGPAGVEVTVNGRRAGKLPLTVVVRPGIVTLELKTEGREPLRQTLEVQGGKVTRHAVVLPPPRPVPRPAPPPAPPPARRRGLHPAYALSLLAASVALAGTAAGTGLLAMDRYETFKAEPTATTRSRVAALRDATNALWALAGATAAAGVVLAVLASWKPQERRVERRARVQVELTGTGLHVHGVF